MAENFCASELQHTDDSLRKLTQTARVSCETSGNFPTAFVATQQGILCKNMIFS